jgi:hypothetical protein
MSRTRISLAVLLLVAAVTGQARAESCTKSRDFILANASDLPQKPQTYRQLFQSCLETLKLTNVQDALVLKSGAIAVLPRRDTLMATAATLAQFCERFPYGTLQFIARKNQTQIADIGRAVRSSSAQPNACAKIKSGG